MRHGDAETWRILPETPACELRRQHPERIAQLVGPRGLRNFFRQIEGDDTDHLE